MTGPRDVVVSSFTVGKEASRRISFTVHLTVPSSIVIGDSSFHASPYGPLAISADCFKLCGFRYDCRRVQSVSWILFSHYFAGDAHKNGGPYYTSVLCSWAPRWKPHYLQPALSGFIQIYASCEYHFAWLAGC